MNLSKNALIQFKNNSFDYEDIISITGLNKNSARNLISDLMKEGMLISKTSLNDKRKSNFLLNWLYIVQKLKKPDKHYTNILKMLGLNESLNKHVLLKNFEIIDQDDNLLTLTRRAWDKIPSDDTVMVTVGFPKDVLTLEFE